MFKIEINFFSNIKLKSSKTTITNLYKKVHFTKILYLLNHIFKKQKIQFKIISTNVILSNKLTLIRSPFHYKNSKTIINSKKQSHKIIFYVKKNIKPLFLLNNIKNSFINFNKNNNIVIKKIKITH